MAINSYTTLRDAVLSFSHRGDADLMIDTFICLAESEMTQNPTERLKIRPQETRATAVTTTDSRFLALPAGFSSMRRMLLTVDGKQLEVPFASPTQMNVRESKGTPSKFSVTSQLEFDAVSDRAYAVEMQYIADFTPLTQDNPTNVVLTQNPNIYLYGVLHQLFIWAVEEVRAAEFQGKFLQAIVGANRKDKDARFGPKPRIAVKGSTP